MAASILNSERAIAMSGYVIRAFGELRDRLAQNSRIIKRLAEIDRDLILHDVALRDAYESSSPFSPRRPSRHGSKSASRPGNPKFGPVESPEWEIYFVRQKRPRVVTLPLRSTCDCSFALARALHHAAARSRFGRANPYEAISLFPISRRLPPPAGDPRAKPRAFSHGR